MKKEFTVERLAPTRELLTFVERNRKGELIQIELTKCTPDNTSEHSLAVLWHKKGYINRVLPHYWHINTYATDEKGNCWGYYNPQIVPNTNKINFDWILKATEENRQRLIDEVYRLASSC